MCPAVLLKLSYTQRVLQVGQSLAHTRNALADIWKTFFPTSEFFLSLVINSVYPQEGHLSTALLFH